jgi:hypothetical protein
MSKKISFGAAKMRFANLVTSNTTIESAIQEVVDRVYELGRWPGTTESIVLSPSLFELDVETNWYYLLLDDDVYDGVIGFRMDGMGWDIMDQSMLFKEGRPGGNDCFVDFGPVEISQTVDAVTTILQRRKYRAPAGFNPGSFIYYALVKKEPPVLTSDDNLIPIHSMGALKLGIQAVCYENVADDDRSEFKWNKFYTAMTAATRQSEGPKKYYIGMDMSLRRKPQQRP